jgi:geranylgeranyl diphosphate synthase, type II
VPTTQGELVRDVLAEYGALTRAHLLRYVQATGDHAPLWQMVSDYPMRGGRSLRGSLCIAAARAFGAGTREALCSAVSLELMHNAFLVHDDIEDESEERRGQPALHRLHGVAAAINVGDATSIAALQPLIANRHTMGPRLALRVLEETERMARETVEGQALELAWRARTSVDLDEKDYLRMILKKTCWYTTIYPCRVGALIGSRDRLDLDRYIRFGFLLGAAFQIQDDLLNLIGDQHDYGKEICGDIVEGKRTLMLIHLHGQLDGEDAGRLSRFLHRPRSQRSTDDMRWVHAAFERHGSIDYGRAMAHGLAGAAMHEAEQVFGDLPESRDKRFLYALGSWVLERC